MKMERTTWKLEHRHGASVCITGNSRKCAGARALFNSPFVGNGGDRERPDDAGLRGGFWTGGITNVAGDSRGHWAASDGPRKPAVHIQDGRFEAKGDSVVRY